MRPHRILLVAGEASGDLHASGVIRELRRIEPDIELFGVGGDRMAAEGMDVLRHISGLSFMGTVEVLRNLGTIRRLSAELEDALRDRRPDVVMLVDYPGFNLRFARTAKQAGVPVLYYISPQVWAWHRSRVRSMKGIVDRMNVVFPFEVDLYRAEGIEVEFVGHPLAERIGSTISRDEFFERWRLDRSRKLVGLFPGSRLQEIERILPVMLRAGRLLRGRHGAQIAVSVAPNLGAGPLRPHLSAADEVVLVEDATYDLMRHCDAGIVTSGTATLEMGWFGTPMAIVYRTSALTYLLGRMLVQVDSIGLANIVAGKPVVPEFIQGRMTPELVSEAIGRMLTDPAYAAEVRKGLSVIRGKLGPPGASKRVAHGVLDLAEHHS